MNYFLGNVYLHHTCYKIILFRKAIFSSAERFYVQPEVQKSTVHSQTSSYHEIASDERIRSNNSHNLDQLPYRLWLIFSQSNSTMTGAGIELTTSRTEVRWLYHWTTTPHRAATFLFFWPIKFSDLRNSNTTI